MFFNPVAVTPGTTYVASYLAPNGHYSVAGAAFATANTTSPPLYALANTTTPNGLFTYGPAAVFPTSSFNATNYFVDPVFTQNQPTTPTAPTAVTAQAANASAVVSWTAPASTGGEPISSYIITPLCGTAAQTPTVITGNPPATSATVTGLTNGTAYTFTVTAANPVGAGPASAPSAPVTPSTPTTAPGSPHRSDRHRRGRLGQRELDRARQREQSPHQLHRHPLPGQQRPDPDRHQRHPARHVGHHQRADEREDVHLHRGGHQRHRHEPGVGGVQPGQPQASPPACPCTIFATTSPAVADGGDAGAVNLGVDFTSDTNGFIDGIRFYKAATNTGTHIGDLWTTSGTKLAQATFTGEPASGWQQVFFSTPVAVTAGTTYVASYLAPVGHYSATAQTFLTAGVDSPPLHALANTATPTACTPTGPPPPSRPGTSTAPTTGSTPSSPRAPPPPPAPPPGWWPRPATPRPPSPGPRRQMGTAPSPATPSPPSSAPTPKRRPP